MFRLLKERCKSETLKLRTSKCEVSGRKPIENKIGGHEDWSMISDYITIPVWVLKNCPIKVIISSNDTRWMIISDVEITMPVWVQNNCPIKVIISSVTIITTTVCIHIIVYIMMATMRDHVVASRYTYMNKIHASKTNQHTHSWMEIHGW